MESWHHCMASQGTSVSIISGTTLTGCCSGDRPFTCAWESRALGAVRRRVMHRRDPPKGQAIPGYITPCAPVSSHPMPRYTPCIPCPPCSRTTCLNRKSPMLRATASSQLILGGSPSTCDHTGGPLDCYCCYGWPESSIGTAWGQYWVLWEHCGGTVGAVWSISGTS